MIKTGPEVYESCIGEKRFQMLQEDEEWEYIDIGILEVVKENQILQKGDITIDSNDENATLVDFNIYSGDQIIVMDSKIHENRDIADEMCITH